VWLLVVFGVALLVALWWLWRYGKKLKRMERTVDFIRKHYSMKPGMRVIFSRVEQIKKQGVDG